MTRKIKRMKEFDVELTIPSDAFIRTPRPAQRNWLLNQALREFADDLQHLDTVASRFVAGAERRDQPDREGGELEDHQIMEDWMAPLMTAMSDIVTASAGDVLEVGFGRGVSATRIQQRGVRSHTIIECNRFIARRFDQWTQDYPGRDISLAFGKWQDVIGTLGAFDAVFFHAYVLNEEEAVAYLSESVTFAEHFFPHAAEHLRPGGVFTYLSNETDSLSRGHQRRLLRHFRSYRVRVIPLQLPDDVQDAWWADSMAVVEATT